MKQVTKYQADNGKAFDTAFDAAREDLLTLLADHIGNDVMARQAMDGICHNPKSLQDFSDAVDTLWQNRIGDAAQVAKALQTAKAPPPAPVIGAPALIPCKRPRRCAHKDGTCTRRPLPLTCNGGPVDMTSPAGVQLP